ncbi:MAG: hypothetical protein WC421_05110 [Elusimicrobiales bacterium]
MPHKPYSGASLLFSIAVCVLLCGCVDVPVQEAAAPAPRAARLRDLGMAPPGLAQSETVHFVIRAPSAADAERYGKYAEQDYENIMSATGLYSFMPQTQYEIVVYGSRQEYLDKTGQPAWSAGMTLRNAVAVYDGEQAPRVLAHEMTHLIFNEFMRRPRPDLRWLNEGLAVYTETLSMDDASVRDYRNRSLSAMKSSCMDMNMLSGYVPAQDDTARLVDTWYMQCESTARFMIEEGGRFQFSVFLTRIRDGADADAAVNDAWRGKWQGLRGVFDGWKKYLGII